MKVGQLAAQTGLTVRTLHHYDEIGLLRPGARTEAGHRVYGPAEVERLHQIASLRQLGLGLEEIRQCLDSPDMTLERVLDMQIRRLDEEMDERRRLRARIEDLRHRLQTGEGASVARLLQGIAATVDYRRHYSPEQLDELRRRESEVGESRMKAAETEWRELFEAFGEAMDRGIPPGAEEVLELARRSRGLIDEFTGGDPAMLQSLTEMYRTEGPEKVMQGHGLPMRPGLWEYMGEARTRLAEGEARRQPS